MDRPFTTLFMLMSLDGKISTGSTDWLDFDKDIPCIKGASEGLAQYYEIEQSTELWSLNSGRTLAKVGINEVQNYQKGMVSFIVIDNSHLTDNGVRNLCMKSDNFVLITTNKNHPAFGVRAGNMHIICQEFLNLKAAFAELKMFCGCNAITIQTGGTLNAKLLRDGLIDQVDIIIAPLLIGGSGTPTIIDGDSLTSVKQLHEIRALKLQDVTRLIQSYIRLRYLVVNESTGKSGMDEMIAIAQ